MLALSNSVLVLAGPVQAFVQSRLNGVHLLAVNVVALLVDLVLMVTLIPHYGLWGAVIANVSAALTRLGLLLSRELRGLGLRWLPTLVNAAPILFGALTCLGALTLVPLLGWGGVASALACILGGGAVLVALLFATRTGLTRGDADGIGASLPARVAPQARLLLTLLSHARTP